MPISISLAVPLDSNSAADQRAAYRYQDFLLGIIGNPTFLKKDYPSEVLSTTGINLTSSSSDSLDFWSNTYV